MVKHRHQHGGPRRQPDQRQPKRRTPVQIDRFQRQRTQRPPQLFGGRDMSQVVERSSTASGASKGGMISCTGAAILHRKAGAQVFMPRDDGGQGAPQRAFVQVAVQPQAERHVVGAAARQQAVQEPEPLLRIGQGQRLAPVGRRDRVVGRRRRCRVPSRSASAGAKSATFGPLEQQAQRHIDAKPARGRGR